MTLALGMHGVYCKLEVYIVNTLCQLSKKVVQVIVSNLLCSLYYVVLYSSWTSKS